jgi:glycosyltransferase involved in cell wall biosynthesis
VRILIVTDAWTPQVNGVVTCLSSLEQELMCLGHVVKVLSPQDFRSVPCPTYNKIPLVWDLWRVGPAIQAFSPDCVHLATEGPLGWAARFWLKRRGLAFSTAIHTRFPEYVTTRFPFVPLRWGYALLRHFHAPSQAVLVTTERLYEGFSALGFTTLKIWRKGVDAELFYPSEHAPSKALPVFLYVGRVALEKNLRAFLDLAVPGIKRVVGDGPERETLQQEYPDVQFSGYLFAAELREAYQQASVLVFPSLTDTYGLVMVEAIACGTPVAAFPVAGPLDVIVEGVSGVMSDDLQAACMAALSLDRERCSRTVQEHSWRASAEAFLRAQPALDGQPCMRAEPSTG